ncbi:autotransporter outer membrane beta-barrel domain-containing protein [Brevundimonas subvibrioides]|uniref:autotransporter outer membrane beta-barrel domain-containing protein n=1 Tax=Brevundimonas subvibrioides TaxID=74313 RepID=UPI0022B3BA34|nr:autotransporter outer membrane beta-barrel domain-containing protein [Brevundimonas subvibrioides]
MIKQSNEPKLVRVAGLIDQLAARIDRAPPASASCRAAVAELDRLCAMLSGSGGEDVETIVRALGELRERLLKLSRSRHRKHVDLRAGPRLARSLRRIALIVVGMSALAVPMVAAARVVTPPLLQSSLQIGDTVIHPVTGMPMVVVSIEDNGVIVDGDLFILTTTGIGSSIPDPAFVPDPAHPDAPVPLVTIASTTVNATTNLVERVTFTDSRTLDVVTTLSLTDASGGAGGDTLTLPAGTDDLNSRTFVQRGSGGRGGRDGALFVSARAGGNGGTGPTINETVGASNGNITTVTAATPGLIAASIGGNGGGGGTSYLGSGGARGGNAGAGGSATLTSRVGTISTTGAESHGVVAQSRAGRGGPGGGSIGFSSGGSGGSGGVGGTATVTNYSTITTRGVAAHGVFAQSLGGAAGDGGSSYGITGSGGDGNTGGDGGQAEAINFGSITTYGSASFGVAAQSIGGIGGDSGNAGGIVTFTSSGAPGGNGGTAIVRAETGSAITTSGTGSHGLFAQSIGGGGGNGGVSAGLVSLGAQGGTGGNGGQAEVRAGAGTFVTTHGDFSHGIFGQSIGGGGGNGGVTAGAVAFGAGGSGGGIGRNVIIDSGARIETTGLGSRGIFGQSIGGGGGSAYGTGGLVSLGGSGGAAGTAGTVTISTGASSRIVTEGRGGDGIFAQSIGGGGGSGSTSGGLVALGGVGGAGGNGNIVTVTNNGTIGTSGDFSRGIFAQSVGGGGGNGGEGGGLVTLGGRGAAASDGAAVTVTNAGAIETAGHLSSAIQVQSIGGGGGDGGSTGGAFAIGGGAGGGGRSGLVTVNTSHDLTTSGNDSHSIFAQSVGGGGGNGGAAGSLSAFAGVAIGGSAGNGGDGGQVDVNLTPRTVTVLGAATTLNPLIQTSGDRSRGIFAQSVGGGGGNGGFATQVTGGFIGAFSLALGGSGGSGGLGDLVRVDGQASILTEGDYSEGLFAQSVGGGGGNGGFAVSLSGAGGPGGGSVSVGVGGSGGSGGRGGQVAVDSGGLIQTRGDFSTGLVAQSVGGGGGNGGFTVTIAAAAGAAGAASVSVGVGGSGGSGGAGGQVTADFDGAIHTGGDDAGGALIQSVGGGGGNGGFSVSGAIAASAGASGSVAVGIGGSGGSGGAGGTVTGHVLGDVETLGDRSTGVVVQSVGGGGGNGGFNITGSIAGGTGAGALGVGLGGSGGGGGAGGSATGSTGRRVTTFGDQSGGLLVQSVGGGGGNGGFNVTGSIGAGGSFGGAGAFGMGGSGGSGGSGGQVRGDAYGRVYTEGFQSSGVVVQSVGGGGGNGGFNVSGAIGGSGSFAAAVAIGLGGSGGGGGNAGEVDASAVGISTLGDQSGGFLAQSVGGGGGSGGFNVSGGIAGSGGSAAAVTVGLGGSGGTGGVGRRVGATVVGDVTTLGDQSSAIVAQSLGGGGGSGGFNVSGGIVGTGGAGGAINVGLGGSGGGGGSSGAVTLAVTGAARTAGLGSDGVLAQSVGGGGGNAGFNITGGITGSAGAGGTIGIGIGGSGGSGGTGGAVSLDVNSGVADPARSLLAVQTGGDGARGIVAQSIGGGGGNGGFNITGSISASLTAGGNIGVGVGGSGGDGGDAAAVSARINGDVLTAGDDASAILVQSLGGGGGNGGFNVSAGVALSQTGSGNLLVGVGGLGGGGGDAGNVDATITSDIETFGQGAFGASAQSLGGGGGNGGFNITAGLSLTLGSGLSGNLGVGVGGFGGDGGMGRNVTASLTGNVLTRGDEAHGVLLQSVGGGGGAGGFNITGGLSAGSGMAGTIGVGLGGFGGGGGNAGTVTGTLTGDVTTLGDGAFGAMMQSVGGGGGAGGMNVTGTMALTASSSAAVGIGFGLGGFGGDGGDGASVQATVTGIYNTRGDEADGVIVQSLGGGGGAGGLNITGSIVAGAGTAGSAAIGIGGFGGGGGNSGTAGLTRVGDTRTDGADSDGIIVQSIAGGGGAGGLNVSGGIAATTNGNAGAFGFGLGGFGGDGGDAGAVTASITGNVIATGLGSDTRIAAVDLGDSATGDVLQPGSRERLNGSNGVLVQSVGGGGGAGGLNVTGQISVTPPGPANAGRAVSIGIGGFGGAGGDAGTVNLTLRGPGATRIQAVSAGDDRSAVTAQSIGGGGGSGGMNISGGIAMDGQLTAGIGGFGGGGGLGRDVSASVTADLFAAGNRSRGLMVQSIGGGGGHGGINLSGGLQADRQATEPSMVFGMGGNGGAGNRSGNVTVTQRGQVQVEGVDSTGILVQSVAGGGGSGGLNVAGNITTAGGTRRLSGLAFAAGIGGTGGAGADAGDVSLNSVGNVIVNGRLVTPPGGGASVLQAVDFTGGSVGVLVQSIGGGGGSGGLNVTGVLAPSGQPVAVGIGGSGGAGGHAGSVTVTRGYETIGGVETRASALIRTFGDSSTGLLAQSVGGGGGNAGMNLTFAATRGSSVSNPVAAVVSVGGSGADAGNGDTVSVRHAGDIVTDGETSDGLFAQSVGGGGGNGSFNLGRGLMSDANALTMAVGGSGGAAGSGGDVQVAHVGTIVTSGYNSAGIRAQSIGGGGGNASVDDVSSEEATNELTMTLGRAGGLGGTAGDVSVIAGGAIDTSGDLSSGILAQSIAGGGGSSGFVSIGASTTTEDDESYNVGLSIGLNGGVGAVSGDVSVTSSAAIVTRGAESRGIMAQSVGGGGGEGSSASDMVARDSGTAGSAGLAVGGSGGIGAVAGQVSVTSTGSIITLAENSDGILAQSIGGGGGTGGSVVGEYESLEDIIAPPSIEDIITGLVTLDPGGGGGGGGSGPSRSISVNVGGDGGTGGDGGAVSVVNRGLIATSGLNSAGIRAQSVGGGGGMGGAVTNIRVAGTRSAQSVDLNVGGSGGVGGTGASVSVLNEGYIQTLGRDAMGISAISVGGGGGDAGLVLDIVAGVTGTSEQDHRVAINVGGSGGVGGTGGNVSVINRPTGATGSGTILTQGEGAYGIFAQSLGGGGGNGSSILQMTGLSVGTDSVSIGFNLGGSGGSGNAAGRVDVLNGGLIDTSGAGAHGIVAQSIGGGGGNGGMAVAAGGALASTGTSPLIAIGGTGGSGGNGGAVTVTNTGAIVTRGAGSHGIVAQSIGGGGGNAAVGFSLTSDVGSLAISNALAAIVGATGGGTGGTGGSVTVNHSGDITVLGEGSVAIRAESINGGGGTLDLDFSALTGLLGTALSGPGGAPEVTEPVIRSRAGGDDVSSMNAGSVTVNSTGTFGLAGANSLGLSNQSIGGGGGTIDLQVGLAAPVDPTITAPAAPVAFDIGLGGVGGRDNDGGDIGGGHTGRITTLGRNTPGALIQSIGGGGGRAILDIEVPTGASLGPVAMTLGAARTLNATGGDIVRTQGGQVVSVGDLSAGAILQSIGGGGGSASIRISGAGAAASPVADGRNALPATTLKVDPEGPLVLPAGDDLAAPAVPQVTIAMGAQGGSGLHGGLINAGFTGGVTTQGAHAPGLIIQSIGAGGGEVRLSGVASPGVSLGGSAGASGNGGNIAVTNSGRISTAGAGSHGVFLQSIGGGGGAVFGAFTAPTVSLNRTNSGDGGAIVFNQTGDIVVSGARTYGLIAQSLGGGGGWVDGLFAGTAGGTGRGGTIDLTVSGSIFAPDANGVGVLAQSLGSAGAGNINLTSNGLIRGGAVGVRFSGGANNRIRTSGSVSATSGLAIDTGAGNDRVENTGQIFGNLDLGSGNNSVLNGVGGVFTAFSIIDLQDGPGSSGTFTNAGDFLMGLSASRLPIDLAGGATFGNLDRMGDPSLNLLFGARVNNTVALDGNFVQTAAGHLAFDVAFGPYASDRVNVSGDATVNGTGDVILTWLENADRVTLFATGGNGTDNGLNIRDTLGLDYRIEADGDGVHLAFTPRFGQPFLNVNGRTLGFHMNSAILEGGSSGIGRLMTLIGNLQTGDEALYSSIFTELNPEPLVAMSVAQFTAARDFSSQMFNCGSVVDPATDRCAWAQVEMSSFDRDTDFEAFSVRSEATARFRAGFERPLQDRWMLGGAIGHDRIRSIEVGDWRAVSEGTGFHGGLGLRRNSDNGVQVAVSMSGGWQQIDTARAVNVFEPLEGTSSPNSGYLQASAQVARIFSSGALFARPAFRASVTALHHAGFKEAGLAGLGVEGHANTDLIGTLNPELSLGFAVGDQTRNGVTFAVTLGGVFHTDDQLTSPMRLQGSNPEAMPAYIASPIDGQAYRAGAELRWFGDHGESLRLSYTGEYGDRTESHSAGLDLRIRF